MLNVMRSSSKLKYILVSIIFLAMGGLALVNQGTFMGGSRGLNVARVGGQKISRGEFDRMMQSTMRMQRMSPQQAVLSGLPQKELDQEITRRLFSLKANDMGILVNDEIVRKKILELLKPFTGQGLDEKKALSQLLYGYGMNEDELVALLRRQTANETLGRIITEGAKAPGQMLDDAMKYRYEWRRGEYVKITAADLPKTPDPSDDKLKEYYKTISSRFMLPEFRSFSVLMLDRTAIGGKAEPDDADLKAYYDAHADSYTEPEKRQIAQVVVDDEATAKKIYADAKAGKSLKELADALDKDAVKGKPKKASYVENTYTANDLPQELSGAFKQDAGGLLEPVKSPLGWHVLDIEKITPAAPKPFDSVKKDVAKAYESEHDDGEAMYKLADDVDDMVGGGQNLAEIAKHYGLKLHSFAGLDEKGMTEDGKKADTDGVPVFDKVLAAAFTGQKNVPSERIDTPNGGFLLVEVTGVTPAQERAFDKVRAEVLKDWHHEKDIAALDEKVSKVMERIKLGDSFDKVAQSLGKKPQMTDFVQRREDPADKKAPKLDRGMVPALFSIDKVGEVTTVNGADSVTIMRLAGRKIDLPKDTKREDMDALRALLGQSIQSDLLMEYRHHLWNKYDVETYPEVLASMYKNNDDAGE